jgi:hypothetical protein
MKLKVRYPAAVLALLSSRSFVGWAFAKCALVDIGLDAKYLGSGSEVDLAEQALWPSMRSWMGWVCLVSTMLLLLLLAYRWLLVPSRN